MTGSRSEWTRAERLRTVLEGRRHLGQQVIEAIFVSNESFSSADAESRLRDLVREVVVLREARKQVGAVHRLKLRRGRPNEAIEVNRPYLLPTGVPSRVKLPQWRGRMGEINLCENTR